MFGLPISMAAFWIIVAGVALLIEAITTGLTSIWFTIGGFVAAVAAWLGAGLPVQIILFLVVSIALMLLVRPLAKKKVTGEVVPTSAHGSRKAKKAPDSESTVQTEKGTLKSSKEESYLLQIQELKEQVRTMDMELAKVRRELIRAQESKERLKKAIGSVLDNY